LWAVAIDPTDKGHCGKTALMLAIESGNLAMLQWLLDQGFDVAEVDNFGDTALRFAVQQDAVDFVAMLLQAGADPKQVPENDQSNIFQARSIAVVRMLVAAGENFNNISRDIRSLLTKVPDEKLQISLEHYQAGKHPRFGLANPELMLEDFWAAMICSARTTAWGAKSYFGEEDEATEPVWSYNRYGQSITELPDGRIIEIGGEHEDFYDSDFYIYNDVVVYDGQGNFQIFGYPKAVFPPTDFHTATLVEDYIYIIGRLGYYQTRAYHQTPVYRLDCRSYQIEPLITAGNNPGWIYEHRAEYQESGVIVISGGSIEDAKESKENSIKYQLDLETLVWK
jgi:hypothetical protein